MSHLAAAAMALVRAGVPVARDRLYLEVDPVHSRDIDIRSAARREAGAGKPWRRGGRQTIRQRRTLAFASRRRS